MNLREAPLRTVYTPMAQAEAAVVIIQIEIRTAQAAGRDGRSGPRRRSASVSGDLVLRYVRTMDQQIDASLVRERLLATLVGRICIAGARALRDRPLRRDVVHGDPPLARNRHSDGAGRRARPGARPGVVADVRDCACAGTVAGIVVALMTTRTLSAFLFGLSGRDPLTLMRGRHRAAGHLDGGRPAAGAPRRDARSGAGHQGGIVDAFLCDVRL